MGKRANGEGSVFQRKSDGRWVGLYTVEYDHRTKKAKQKSVYGKSQEEVLRKLKEKQSLIQKGYLQDHDNMLVCEWMDYWLWRIKKSQVKPKTFTGYEERVRLFINPSKLGKLKIQNVRRSHVQIFFDDMLNNGKSDFTIRATHRILSNAFNQAVHRGILPISPVSKAKDLSIPKAEGKPIKVFNKEEQDLFFNIVKEHRLETVYVLAITSGLREGEITALKWSDFDEEYKTISVSKNAVRVPVYDSKTNKPIGSKIIVQDTPKSAAGKRIIPLHDKAVDALKAHKRRQQLERLKNGLKYTDNNLIFCNVYGNMYDPSTLYSTLRKIYINNSLEPIKFHSLRHTFATRGLEQGMSAKELQALLGHETPEMVMHYQHVLPLQARVAMDKLANAF